jgi:penicillin-binding protein 2
MKWWRKRRRDPEIAPDEIFLDSSNTPDFDRSRFEGRLEKPLSDGTFVYLGGVLGVLFLILIFRAGNLEIAHGQEFATESAHNSLETSTLFAQRGVITDVNGVVLADNTQNADGSMERDYPIPELGQIIGYVSYPKKDSKGNYYDIAETGVAGLEEEYDSTLAGKNGQLLTETDVAGNVRSEGTVVPAVDGQTLKLSVDANMEQLLAKAIKDTADSQGFIAGAGVIMDVNSGAVRAIVSYPSYDPNVMANGSPADTIAAYNNDLGRPFLDHAVQGVYAPGSIVKPFVASGALTDGIITPDTIIDDPGSLSVPDPYHPGQSFVYKGWKALGPVNVEQAIAWSSDIFFYTVGGGFGSQKGLGIDRLDYWFQQFGLGSPTGIDLSGEAKGLVPTPAWKETVFGQPWYTGDTYDTAIGQYSMQVTPIQMVRATASIVNGGKLFTPTLLAGKTPSYTNVPVNPSVLPVIEAGMRLGVTVPGGLSSPLNFSYVTVAAKTGTAQTGVTNQYDNSWVEGFFPYDNPQYAFAVVLERGPPGSGEQAVRVMQELFDSLHAENSPYVGGTATSSDSLAL